MSALAKPMIHSTTGTVNPSAPVNIEKVLTVSKIDTPDGTYGIAFHFGGGTPDVIWKYASASLRNTDYTNLIGDVSTAVA